MEVDTEAAAFIRSEETLLMIWSESIVTTYKQNSRNVQWRVSSF